MSFDDECIDIETDKEGIITVCMTQKEMGPKKIMICPPRTKPDGKTEFHKDIQGAIKSLNNKGISNDVRVEVTKLWNKFTRPAQTIKADTGVDASAEAFGKKVGVGLKRTKESSV
jgi:hypothetical protein